MKIIQRTLSGGLEIVTGNRVRDQLCKIMEQEARTRADEDLLAAYWLQDHAGFGELASETLARIIRAYRKADIRRRRQELAQMGYPWSPEEAERREKRSRGGPP